MDDVIKVGVLSDIHSNLCALEAVIEACREENVNEFIVLGDSLCDWHKPNETLELIRSVSPLVISGETENMVLQGDNSADLWKHYDIYSSLLWTYEELSESNKAYLKTLSPALSITGDNYRIKAAHCSSYGLFDSVSEENILNILERTDEDLLLLGGTHNQGIFEKDGKMAVCPGSVGIHFNTEHNAEYAVITLGEETHVSLKSVSYPMEQNFAELMKSSLYAKAFDIVLLNYYSMCQGTNETAEFLRLIEEARSKDEFSRSGPVPNDIFEEIFDVYYSKKITSLMLPGIVFGS